MIHGADWSTQQLAEFLAFVSVCTDERDAVRTAVERAAESLEAEVGLLVFDGEVVASIGLPGGVVDARIAAAVRADGDIEWPLPTPFVTLRADVEGWDRAVLYLIRTGEEPFAAHERSLVRGMVRVLALARRMLERQKLLDRLSRIQRSISHRAPLQEVLDGITAGARDLLGDDLAAIRLVDADDPTMCSLVSTSGIAPELLPLVERSAVGEGAGGLAILEGRLVVMESYRDDPKAIPTFAAGNMTAAMAAPVREEGRVVGSLVVATYRAKRHYSESEREVLSALAEHASLALTDAKTLEAMREAQRAKDMFLAMVSHELRTPLTVMMGALRTLEQQGSDMPEEEVLDMLARGYRRGQELERLIDRLLRGAHAELTHDQEVTSIRELVHELAASAGEPDRVEIGQITDGEFWLERSSAREVGVVFVENAVSHAPAGSTCTIDATVEDGELRLTVTNPGSLPSDCEPDRLFEPFQRGPNATSPGVGLGLYIAAQVARGSDGSVEAESSGGSVRFRLRLPVRALDGLDRDLEMEAGAAGDPGIGAYQRLGETS